MVPVPEKLARDEDLLAALGPCAAWQYATHAGISEATARARLRRLHEAGRADRVRERHTVGWVYAAVKG